ERYVIYLLEHPELRLSEVCTTARAGRAAFSHQLVVRAQTMTELVERLTAYVVQGSAPETIYDATASIPEAAPVAAAPVRRVALPTYCFERQRYWARPRHTVGLEGTHPLLGRRLRSALSLVLYESVQGGERLGYLRDHVVQGAVIFPGAGYVELALLGVHDA